MKRLQKIFAVIALLGVLVGTPAYADSPPMLDLVVLRPIGLSMTALGTVAMVALTPCTLIVCPTKLDLPFVVLFKSHLNITFLYPFVPHRP